MKNKGLESLDYANNDRNSEDVETDVNTSPNKKHINPTSKEIESHVQKKGRSSGNSKKNCSSNSLQFLKSTNMIASQIQGDTFNLTDVSQSSAGDIAEKKSDTVLSDEKCSYRNSSFYIDDLGAEDEIFLLQCPKNYIRQNLINQTFDFGKANKIVDAKTNEVLQLNVLSIGKKSLTIAMPRKGKTGVLIKFPLKGHILIKKIVKTPFCHHEFTNGDNIMCETGDKLLKDFKSRHPLLGINWKAHIDLADEAFKRQNKREMKKKLKVKKTENCKSKKKFEAESFHVKKKIKLT